MVLPGVQQWWQTAPPHVCTVLHLQEAETVWLSRMVDSVAGCSTRGSHLKTWSFSSHRRRGGGNLKARGVGLGPLLRGSASAAFA